MANRAGVEGLVHMPLKWGWLLALGIVLILVGTFSVAVSVVATIASVLLFGWLLLFHGRDRINRSGPGSCCTW